MSSQHPAAPEGRIDPIDVAADQIAAESMGGLEGLLPASDFAALEEIIAISLAHQPELRRMVRKLVPDPVVAGSGDVPTRGQPESSGDAERGTGSDRK